jgi:molybdate-binding protein
MALALATLAATMSVGSQLGLVALYSGEADVVRATPMPSGAASQAVASALPIARRSQSTGTKFDPAQDER